MNFDGSQRLLVRVLPQTWAMVDPQPWGPPYEAALWRWVGFALVAAAVLVFAVRDPLDRGPRDRHNAA